jgi:hypothetical protein
MRAISFPAKGDVKVINEIAKVIATRSVSLLIHQNSNHQ